MTKNKAIRDYKGYGVMLIGVTQDEVCGLENIPEQHEFEGVARSYFGSAVPKYRFSASYLRAKIFCLFIVDPPVNGQEILYALEVTMLINVLISLGTVRFIVVNQRKQLRQNRFNFAT